MLTSVGIPGMIISIVGLIVLVLLFRMLFNRNRG